MSCSSRRTAFTIACRRAPSSSAGDCTSCSPSCQRQITRYRKAQRSARGSRRRLCSMSIRRARNVRRARRAHPAWAVFGIMRLPPPAGAPENRSPPVVRRAPGDRFRRHIAGQQFARRLAPFGEDSTSSGWPARQLRLRAAFMPPAIPATGSSAAAHRPCSRRSRSEDGRALRRLVVGRDDEGRQLFHAAAQARQIFPADAAAGAGR
jgi:hypothetical protein